MEKVGVFGIVLLVGVLLVLPVVEATINLGEVNSVYNFGDEIDVSVRLEPGIETNDFLVGKLICDGKEETVYKNPKYAGINEKKDVSINFILHPKLIGEMSGNCVINIGYGGVFSNTESFELSKEIKVELDVGNVSYNPGEGIKISGKAMKKNGKLLSGKVEILVPDMGIQKSGDVSEGEFAVLFKIPENAKSGIYDINVRAYDGAGKEILNSGEAKRIFKVNQILTNVDIALNAQNIIPGNELVYTPLLLDQAGEKIGGSVVMSIIHPKQKSIFQIDANASEVTRYYIPGNATPGVWNISVRYEKFLITKQFRVEENKNVSAELGNGTLVVKNIGNVPYTGAISISIGGVVQKIEAKLKINEEKLFKLKAPDGSYIIKIDSNGYSRELGRVFLTGNAISVKEIGQGVLGNLSTLIWLFVILCLGLVAVFFYKKIRKKDYTAMIPQSLRMGQSSYAEDISGISSGEKQEVAVVCLNIKNWDELREESSHALVNIEKIIANAKEKNAQLHIEGGSHIFIFTPKFTQEKDNNIRALKFATEIKRIIDEHNNSYAQKIDYGIGVNNGGMIVGSRAGRIRFISIGNVIVRVKNLAESVNKKIMMSENVRGRVVGKVRVGKIAKDWELRGMPDREKHSERIQEIVDENM